MHRQKAGNDTAEPKQASASSPKYPRPQILLVDFAPDVCRALQAAGYNVAAGTFGRPYKVPLGDGYVPVIDKATLPGYPEQEIIVVNLAELDPSDGPDGELGRSRGTKGIWAPTTDGIIDPRPKVMWRVSDDFDRIHDHGGIFIVLAAPRHPSGYVIASDHSYSGLQIHDDLPIDNWSFLSSLSSTNLSVQRDFGREMSIPDDVTAIASFLRGHLVESHFEATISPTYRIEDRWVTIAYNKYEQPVASIIVPDKDSKAGPILLLPQLRDPGTALLEILESFLPTVTPRLFPHAEGAKWVTRPEYELPLVLELKRRIEEIRGWAREEIVHLEREIETERTEHGYAHSLLTQSGDELVAAVRTSFETLGFTDVRDADAEVRARDPSAPRREDLQIHDRTPLLLVEVKGISGLPKEADSLQVMKYVAPRNERAWSN